MADDAVVKGSPSKALFVNVITKDISLGDTILDLLTTQSTGSRGRRAQVPPTSASTSLT